MIIRGSTVSTPMAVPDWNQDNPRKSDYIKNRPLNRLLPEVSEADNDKMLLVKDGKWVSDNAPNLDGKDGADGKDGEDGVGIAKVEQTVISTADGGTNIVTVTLTNGTSYDFAFMNGSTGEQGPQGVQGIPGKDGKGFAISKIYPSIIDMMNGFATDGVEVGGFVLINTGNVEDADNAKLFVKTETAYSYLSDLSGTQGIQGPEGKQGPTGPPGAAGVGIHYIYQSQSTAADGGKNVVTIMLTNGNEYNCTFYNGSKGSDGKDGTDGKDGVSATHSWNGTTLTVTSASGTSSADLKGEKGKDGTNGTNGVSTTHSWNGTTLTVTSASGTSSADLKGDTGASGKDGKDGTNGTNGKDGKDGTNGKDGTTFTPSIANNVLSWTNNGGLTNPPSTYVKGDKGDTPPIVQTAGQSETEVMSQKAVTQLVADALESATKEEYQTVTSVSQMTDTSKKYVLSSTGTLWAYGDTVVEVEAPNKFVPSKATLNQRLSGSSGSVSSNTGSVGSFVTDYIAVSDMASVTPYVARLNWEIPTHDDNKVVFFDSSKARLMSNVFATDKGTNATVANGETILSLKDLFSGSAPDWSKVAFLRFQLFVKPSGTSITSSDTANLTIKFDHEGGTRQELAWYDTGMTPESSTAAGNYVDLLVKVNKNSSDIYNVSERVRVLETDDSVATVPSFWKTSVDECISKIKALQIGRNCVTFPFFSDNHQRNGYAGVLIAKVMRECNIPYCFFGGDSISSGTIQDEATMIAQDKAFDDIMSYVPNGRFCRAVGNHDGYWYDGTNKYYYSRDQVYDLFLREESIAQNKHFGGDGTYYYVDDIASKVRFIVLNSNKIDTIQLYWLQSAALSFNESDWAVVFISHQPISNHYHALISNADEVRTIVKNYINDSSSNKAAVVGWFSGHIHRDRIYSGAAVNTEDDSEGTAMGFKQVTITSDATSIAYDDATKHTQAEDNMSHAIDFVTINKNTRTVNITRLGIGNDRSFTY